MKTVRSRDKNKYLEALHQAALHVGDTPSEGSNATLEDIKPFARYFTQLVSSELQYNIDFAMETSPNVWWYDGQKIVFRSKSTPVMLDAIYNNPDVTIAKLRAITGIAESAVNKQLANMVNKGYIQRSNVDKSWYVFASRSI
ncbi:MAG: MarR family transcriptional regulator [Muribaculaceae bacterium]|nr:MarR family transcriptional regulator [Muribaculaceae bacterium]